MNAACASHEFEEQDPDRRPSPAPKIVVRFAVDDDAVAHKVESVLEALGYVAIREGEDGLGEPMAARLGRLVARLGRRFLLTDEDVGYLAHFILGRSHEQIAGEMRVSVATVKWREHNVLAKTNVADREELLRLAMFGCRRPDEDEL